MTRKLKQDLYNYFYDNYEIQLMEGDFWEIDRIFNNNQERDE